MEGPKRYPVIRALVSTVKDQGGELVRVDVENSPYLKEIAKHSKEDAAQIVKETIRVLEDMVIAIETDTFIKQVDEDQTQGE